MVIYANWRENDGVDLNFFASKEAYLIVRLLEKITVKKAEAKVVKCAKNKSWVPTNPPLSLKGAWSFLFSFFSKLLRFWYHKNCHIFLIIILKFHALIPLRLEENCKNSPILLIWW